MLSLQSYPLLLLLNSNDSCAYVSTWFFEATSFNPENPGGSTTVRLHDGRIGMKMVTRSGGVSIVSFSRLYGAGPSSCTPPCTVSSLPWVPFLLLWFWGCKVKLPVVGCHGDDDVCCRVLLVGLQMVGGVVGVHTQRWWGDDRSQGATAERSVA